MLTAAATSIPDFSKELDTQLTETLEPILKEEADERTSNYQKERRAAQGASKTGRTSTASSLFFGICVGIVLTGMSSMRRG